MKSSVTKPTEPSGKSPARAADGSLWSTPLEAEWMDPMSWRLPSGKALAEFALQSGFLAPLVMRAPQKRWKAVPAAPLVAATLEKSQREDTAASGRFRPEGFRQAR
jgi:hypothetical protein